MYNTLNLRAMENIPNKIYLQIGEDADITIDNSVNDFNDLYRGEITWNDERINENDIEYERRQDADLKNAALPIFGVMQRLLVHTFIILGWFYICRYHWNDNGWKDIMFAICCSGILFWLPKYRDWFFNVA